MRVFLPFPPAVASFLRVSVKREDRNNCNHISIFSSTRRERHFRKKGGVESISDLESLPSFLCLAEKMMMMMILKMIRHPDEAPYNKVSHLPVVLPIVCHSFLLSACFYLRWKHFNGRLTFNLEEEKIKFSSA